MFKQVSADIVVIGSGIAGLYTSLLASEYGKVLLISKSKLSDANTDRAQGGIAAALDKNDSPNLHEVDTIRAGVGLCNPDAVKILTHSAQTELGSLVKMGARFDKEGGKLHLGLEAAHSMNRIVHAGEDTTGKKIEELLIRKVTENPNITVEEYYFAVDFIVLGGRCRGLWAFDVKKEKMVLVQSKATVLCTGGVGQLYLYTTNTATTTGDGQAMAFRAGACLTDMEFVQFHPTALHTDDVPSEEPMFLITEALRGAGAVLVNKSGEAFMLKYHPQAELAPRDVVTRAIFEEIQKSGHPCVFLNVEKVKNFKKRFSAVFEACRQRKISLADNQIPISPAAHYIMGGIKVDLSGSTGISGFFAGGEAACFGTHGANRLAGNSLLEGIVFSRKIAENIEDYLKEVTTLEGSEAKEILPILENFNFSEIDFKDVLFKLGSQEDKLMDLKDKLQDVMWSRVGILRSAQGLEKAIDKIQKLSAGLEKIQAQILAKPKIKKKNDVNYSKGNAYLLVKFFELKNMLFLARLIAEASEARTESRGAHFRTDYPTGNDTLWIRHLIFQKLSALNALKLYT